MKEQLEKGLSPCIGFCSTTYGDDFCRGCYRSFRQVIGWTTLPLSEKMDYFQEISVLAENLMQDKVDIFDEDIFNQSCKRYGVTIYPQLNKYYHLLLLMQKGYVRFIDEGMGVRLLSNNKKWIDLYKWVDHQIFNLIQK